MPDEYIDIVFDGPPANESGRFIEVETPKGASIKVGEWLQQDNGNWTLRIPFNITPLAISDRISQVQSELFAIREDLRDTLDDAKDARFIRLAAELGALASEFLPEESLDQTPSGRRHDFDELRKDYGQTL